MTAPAYDSSLGGPPPVVVTRGDETITMPPFTYCWTTLGGGPGLCADGMRPTDPPTLGGDGALSVEFPSELGFEFGVTVFDDGYTTILDSVEGVQDGDAWTFELPADGPMFIDIFGSGPAGDVIVSLQIV